MPQGYGRAADPDAADLVVVNTCAFIEAARQESIDTVLDLADRRRPGARLVVTGCMAERYGDELRDALPEVDLVAGFGRALTASSGPATADAGRRLHRPEPVGAATPAPAADGFDLLELPRPAARAPWAYVKVAEGCDRICGFCAIPSFRGKQRSRSPEEILAEVDALRAPADAAPPLREIVLVAQDLASYGRDRTRPRPARPHRPRPLAHRRPDPRRVGPGRAHPPPLPLPLGPHRRADRGGPRHGRALLRPLAPARVAPAARRACGAGATVSASCAASPTSGPPSPTATFRSSFILGYPGETERDHDLLLQFLDEAQLDWAGFFPFSNEAGTYAAGLGDQVPARARPRAPARVRRAAGRHHGGQAGPPHR